MKKELINALNGDLNEYKSVPFWSWNNSLEIPELLKQIDDMYSVGIGGFIMHARLGFCDEYLGEKWFACVEACLKKAKSLGMQAWVYDENGWPSGFVGGKLLKNEDFLARYLEFEKGKFDGSAFATFIADEKLGFVRVSEQKSGYEGEYFNIYLRVSPSNTDILNPAVTDAFIAETHEKYYLRFSQSFGRELAGFFTDEPQFYARATPYTPCAEPYFIKDGEDIKDGLIWLFVQDKRGYSFRQKYYGTLNMLYCENYYKKLYEWCDNHGCMLTGHSAEENTLKDQMYGAAAVTPSYEYEHIPAIDCLCRFSVPLLSSKQVSSAASQLGKKFVLTETFACSGHDASPKELKSLAEIQYFNGVNKTCQHLYPYSMAGQGKVDHPPVFSPHANWFEGFKDFNDYFTRLGFIIANTKERCDVAVISPVREIWLNYLKADPYGSVGQIDADFDAFLGDLRACGVTYQLVDERILSRYGAVEGDTLRVGEMRYDKVIIPNMSSIAATTADILSKFGGKLCVLGNIEFTDGFAKKPRLKGNIGLNEIKALSHVKFRADGENGFITERFSEELGEFIFVKNTSLFEPVTVHFESVAQNYVALDLQTLKTRKISNDITLEKCQSLILIKDESASPEVYNVLSEDITQNFVVTSVTDNFFVSDYASFSFDGTSFSEKMPIPQLFEKLLRQNYKGKLFVKHDFYLKNLMPLSLEMEKLKLLSAKVNGEDIEFKTSSFDMNFVIADISHAVKAGQNSFVYEVDYYQHDDVYYALFAPNVTESLRNCLYYDTHIENVYLKGDFVVNVEKVVSIDGADNGMTEFSLEKRENLPALSSENYKNGYPFFKGKLTLKGTYNYSGEGPRALSLSGRFIMAKVKCGKAQTIIALDNKKDITDLLEKGENNIEITLYSSLRNLFGPHHHFDPEPLAVAPVWFNMRGSWGNGIAPNYRHEYHSVPFGVDKIEILSETLTETFSPDKNA